MNMISAVLFRTTWYVFIVSQHEHL